VDLDFRYDRVRLHFRASGEIRFPPRLPANMLRSALGAAFHHIACEPDCQDARTCSRAADCDYARIFEPRPAAAGPSGLADWPRPFVFRAQHLDGRQIRPGDGFHVDINLFDTRVETRERLEEAFRRMGEGGLGPGRGQATLLGAEVTPLVVSLTPVAGNVGAIRVRFVSPTELKAAGKVAGEPEFGILFARLRDRISALRALYGGGPLELDFRALGERARTIRMTHCRIRQIAARRHSSRTGQTHDIGGFVGEAVYEGPMAEFAPYLAAGAATGVGRQTVWGKGEIRFEPLSRGS